jgi:hypothetical protein
VLPPAALIKTPSFIWYRRISLGLAPGGVPLFGIEDVHGPAARGLVCGAAVGPCKRWAHARGRGHAPMGGRMNVHGGAEGDGIEDVNGLK